jgi:hypothetical protein
MDSFGIGFFENKEMPQTFHVEMSFFMENWRALYS